MSRHPSRSPKINFLRLCYAASKWSSKPFRYLKTLLTSTLSQPERLVEVPRTSIFENPYHIGHGVSPPPWGGTLLRYSITVTTPPDDVIFGRPLIEQYSNKTAERGFRGAIESIFSNYLTKVVSGHIIFLGSN